MTTLKVIRYLAHVRQVSHSKMAETPNLTPSADYGPAEDEGVYSIIVSHRPGPLPVPKRSITTPKSRTQKETEGDKVELPKSGIVHLVSLEGIEEHMKLPFDDNPAKVSQIRVGLVSLY